MPPRSHRILPTHELNARRRRIAALKRLPALSPSAPPTPPPVPTKPTPATRLPDLPYLFPGKNQLPIAPTQP